MSVFEPLLKKKDEGKFLEKSTKTIKAKNILEAIHQTGSPTDVVRAERGTKVFGTPYHNYTLRLEKVV